MYLKNIKKNVIVLLIVAVTLGSGWWYNAQRTTSHSSAYFSQFDIRLLDRARDTDFIKQQNYDNWYLLHASPEYDLDFMLQKNSPYHWEPRTYGKLTTVVLFDNNNPAGFINYYMRSLYEGTVFLLDVDKRYRGKGYGEALLRYAVEGLKKQGAKFIKLSVRVENEPAQKLYRKLGFAIATSEQGFHFYRLNF